ncbi:MAG: DUF167 domain-containing protein [Planctomycetaceae bacterium]
MNLPLITLQSGGLILPLKVTPKAKKNDITGVHDGQLKISVTAVPEKGKANQAVLKLLAAKLRVSRSQLEIVKGETSTQKQVFIHNLSREELQSQLSSLLPSC